MRKNVLFLFSLVLVSLTANAQNLTGKILYSHYNFTVADSISDSIYAVNNNGNTLQFVTLGYRPLLSHGSKYMAFSNGTVPNNTYLANIWIRNLQTQTDTEIITNTDYLDYYDFTPSDKQLVYAQKCGIFFANADGSNSYQPIVSFTDCYDDNPDVRLSDSLVLFHDVDSGLFLVKMNGDSLRQIPNTFPGDIYPTWSPDEKWIVYEKEIPGTYFVRNNLYKIKPDGSDTTRLTFFTDADSVTSDPIWSKDMLSVFVIGRINDSIGLYRVKTDGSGSYTLLRPLTSHSVYDYFLGVADSVFTATGVTPIEQPLNSFTVYPNPATDKTGITYSSSITASVTIELYDVVGRKIETLLENSYQPAGRHTIPVDVTKLSDGVYLFTLTANKQTYTQKLVVTH